MDDFDAEAEEWIRTRNKTIDSLHQLADELDLMQKRVNISNLAGSSVSVATGIGSIVCFGLAFVTGGISIVPGIVLAAVGGGGAATTVGAFIGKHFHEKDLLKKVQRSLDSDRHQSERLNTAFAELSTTGITGSNCAKGGIGGAKILAGGLDLLTSPVKGGAKAAAKTVSLAGAFGVVFDLLLLPVDIYVLVSTSIDVHNGSTHEAAVKVRTVAGKLEGERDNFQEQRPYVLRH